MQAGNWSLFLGQVLQAPGQGYYQAIAQASLPVAAALAPALFLLRLALYHWRRLVGEEDLALQVIGDWVAAGVLAIAAGPFLDLLAELGWWIAGATLGETSQLAGFRTIDHRVQRDGCRRPGIAFFSGILVLLMAVGGILAMAGMLFAFGAANAALYVMAVVAAPLAVAGVLRHMRWLRALWIKAVAVLALLPVAAGGIFKASVTLGAFFAGEGLLSLLIRLLWLWGATGFLIALAGILSKVTLSASVEALGQLTRGVKAIVATAVLANSMAGGGAIQHGAGGPASGGQGPGGGAPPSPVGSGASTPNAAQWENGQAILAHYDQGGGLTRQAGTLGAMGLQAPAQYARTQAHGHELTARRLALEGQLARFSDFRSDSTRARDEISRLPDFGFSRTVNQGIAATFSNTVTGFQEGFSGLSRYIEQAGFDPRVVAERYPADTGRMVSAYLDHAERIDTAENSLLEAAILGGAEHFRMDIFPAETLQASSRSQGTSAPGPPGGITMTPTAYLALGALALFSLADLRYRVTPGVVVFFLGTVCLGLSVAPLRVVLVILAVGWGWLHWPSFLIIPALFSPAVWAVLLAGAGLRRCMLGEADLLALGGVACLFEWPASVMALLGVEIWRRIWKRRGTPHLPALPGVFFGLVVYLLGKLLWG